MTTATTTSVAQAVMNERPPLTKQDRCDRCSAQAFVRSTHHSGTTLTFCGHHGNKFSLDMIAQGFIVEDFRHLINDKSESSA